jgi:hypothetical protein
MSRMVISFSNVWQSKCAATFYVFQYGMPEGHWAGTEWILGLADRLPTDDKPYQTAAGGFSRAGDEIGCLLLTD